MILRHKHTRDESAEIARVVLQKMAANKAGFTPLNFAVWYEYVSGANLFLRREIDTILKAKEHLDDGDIDKLFETCINIEGTDSQERISKVTQRIIAEVASTTKDAENAVVSYSTKISDAFVEHTKDNSPQTVRALFGVLQKNTEAMREQVGALSVSLQESQREAQELKQQLESAKIEVLRDPLTHVMNRRGFEEKLREYTANATVNKTHLSFILADIDHFKNVNDTYGHLFGDVVIKTVADFMSKAARDDDIVVRLGGEEFGVLMPNTPPKDAVMFAERIRVAMEKGKIKRGKTEVGDITISMGVTEYLSGEDSLTFIDRADRAMYTSKATGRNKVTANLTNTKHE